MNILNNKNKRTSIFKALALCLFAAVSLTAVSCDDDMDIQQSYPFTVETMPVHAWRFISSGNLVLSRRKGKVVKLII